MTQSPPRTSRSSMRIVAKDIGTILAHTRDAAREFITIAEPNHDKADACHEQLADLREVHQRLGKALDDIELSLRRHRLASLVGVQQGIVYIGPEASHIGKRGVLAGLGERSLCRLSIDGTALTNVDIRCVFPAY